MIEVKKKRKTFYNKKSKIILLNQIIKRCRLKQYEEGEIIFK